MERDEQERPTTQSIMTHARAVVERARCWIKRAWRTASDRAPGVARTMPTEVELYDVIRVLRRRAWLVATIVAVTTGALWLRLRVMRPVYAAEVTIQLSAPPTEDVETFEQYRYVSLRDEVTLARNNLAQLLENAEVRQRTAAALGLTGTEARYGLEVELIRDVDFIRVAVESVSPALAAEIANTHVSEAIAYYGELRARPTGAAGSLFEEQLRVAEEELDAAEGACAEFRVQNRVSSLDDEVTTYRKLLEQLELELDQRRLEGSASEKGAVEEVDLLIDEREQEIDRLLSLAPRYNLLEEQVQQAREAYRKALEESPDAADGAAAKRLEEAEKKFAEFRTRNDVLSLANQLASCERLLEQLEMERDQRSLEVARRLDAVSRLEALIAERQAELNRLLELLPRYKMMEQNAQQARARYEHILSKRTEAELKTAVVQAANFIQVVQPALPPTAPKSNIKLLLLAVVGSIGLGILLAFVLEYGAPSTAATTEVATVARSPRATARTIRTRTQIGLRE